MTETAIKVEGLSKRYRLGAGPMGRGDFREAVSSGARWLRQRLRSGSNDALSDAPETDVRDLWALRDVSFEVRRGEVVGVIGHNGAGKSTLLKILSRITDPTSGEAWFEGRVGSLLEVGTGFHPELSGRENIYLNGAILGMTRREIESKFDEIVAFSEIGRFLDTPVKRYSSGMYVRLAFSVAAHLEPEILVIDEVLAVGDANFQRKCLAKIQDVSHEGRTILFVSHNMGSIQKLCDRALVLRGGRLIGEGEPVDAVKLYLQDAVQHSNADLAERTDRRGRGRARLVSASIFTQGHPDAPGLLIHGKTACVQFEVDRVPPSLACAFTIYSCLDEPICRFTSRSSAPGDTVAEGRHIVCEIPDLPLVPGEYRINVAIYSGSELEDHVANALQFDVEYGALDGRALRPNQKAAVFLPRHQWTLPG